MAQAILYFRVCRDWESGLIILPKILDCFVKLA